MHVDGAQPSTHLAHSTIYGYKYIWSSYPLYKTSKIDYSALFSFDLPSAFLFSFYLIGVVALEVMRIPQPGVAINNVHDLLNHNVTIFQKDFFFCLTEIGILI